MTDLFVYYEPSMDSFKMCVLSSCLCNMDSDGVIVKMRVGAADTEELLLDTKRSLSKNCIEVFDDCSFHSYDLNTVIKSVYTQLQYTLKNDKETSRLLDLYTEDLDMWDSVLINVDNGARVCLKKGKTISFYGDPTEVQKTIWLNNLNVSQKEKSKYLNTEILKNKLKIMNKYMRKETKSFDTKEDLRKHIRKLLKEANELDVIHINNMMYPFVYKIGFNLYDWEAWDGKIILFEQGCPEVEEGLFKSALKALDSLYFINKDNEKFSLTITADEYTVIANYNNRKVVIDIEKSKAEDSVMYTALIKSDRIIYSRNEGEKMSIGPKDFPNFYPHIV